MAILITGSRGTIGMHLQNTLRNKGYEVIGTDLPLTEEDGYTRADITKFEEIYKVFKSNNIDVVYHLAGEVGRLNGELYPQRMIYVNELGTLNIIQLCLEFGAKLIYASSSEIYGDLGEIKLKEEFFEKLPLKPTNVYALSKLFGEYLVRHYVFNYGLRAVSVRPFMIYGPGEYPGKFRSAISNFIYSALTKQKITVHKGTIRSWTYIDDFIEGLIAILTKAKFKGYEAYNLGRDEPRTMEEIAKLIVKLAGARESLIEYIEPPRQFLSTIKLGDFTKAQFELGWVAKTSLEEGIIRTMEWQRKYVIGESK